MGLIDKSEPGAESWTATRPFSDAAAARKAYDKMEQTLEACNATGQALTRDANADGINALSEATIRWVLPDGHPYGAVYADLTLWHGTSTSGWSIELTIGRKANNADNKISLQPDFDTALANGQQKPVEQAVAATTPRSVQDASTNPFSNSFTRSAEKADASPSPAPANQTVKLPKTTSVTTYETKTEVLGDGRTVTTSVPVTRTVQETPATQPFSSGNAYLSGAERAASRQQKAWAEIEEYWLGPATQKHGRLKQIMRGLTRSNYKIYESEVETLRNDIIKKLEELERRHGSNLSEAMKSELLSRRVNVRDVFVMPSRFYLND